ncbi:hypothetical protein P7J56_10820 [Streptococcus suis]|uniref:hypothetical protein n=1 Tax=Streptococcus suis TaxID=1307 RepID=UPI0018613623|nr:hypothetical protein [Streptococcus suis]QGJ85981.1 endonuclease [Streptococcus phage phi-SsuHCJ31_comEC]
MTRYILNNDNQVTINDEQIISNEQLLSAVEFANEALISLDAQTREFEINIFEVMGMRNLSGVVGEYFGKSLQKFSDQNLHSNLHQDGYPDLLLTNSPDKLDYFRSLYTESDGKKYPREKSLFSPYKFGGVEVKATCGSTPSAKKIPKPLIGEQRIDLLNSFDWKAHHRDTNNLIGILWDFINEVPTIIAVFYSNQLSQDDWGKIVQPKTNGGRTTSVSIMNSVGVKKMCTSWIAVIDDEKYIEKLAAKKWIGYNISK